MIRFYLVRHGETEGNKEGFFRGRFDYPLNDRGLKQAEEVAKYFSEIKIDRIYSSPLKRAYQTANAISKVKKIAVIKDEGFNNLYFSSWEGKPKSLIKKQFPQLWKKWIKAPEDLQVDDSETIDQVGNRANKRIYEIIKNLENLKNEDVRDKNVKNKNVKDKGKNTITNSNYSILIATHRVVIKALIAKLLNIPKPYFWKIHSDNASVSIIDYYPDNGFMLYKLNDTSHLSEYMTEIY